MKITPQQCNAASLYWTQILTDEKKPKALIESKQSLPDLMAVMEQMHRKGYLESLAENNPRWSLHFMNKLDSLLQDAENTTRLGLDNGPDSLLKQAAEEAGVPEGLFPSGKLSMTFDNENHIIVGNDEKIDAKEFLEEEAQKITNQMRMGRST